jgi:uncharacterized damage-inducible protein DinB
MPPHFGANLPEIFLLDSRDFFAYTVQLRLRLLEALARVSPELLERDLKTNHHSILQTLIHIMAVHESWLHEDLLGEPGLSWEDFLARYLEGRESLDTVRRGWQMITDDLVRFLRDGADLARPVHFPARDGSTSAITLDQLIYHLATEEMIHLGEVLAMTRQLGIDLPAYHLVSIMDAQDRPWERLVRATGT